MLPSREVREAAESIARSQRRGRVILGGGLAALGTGTMIHEANRTGMTGPPTPMMIAGSIAAAGGYSKLARRIV